MNHLFSISSSNCEDVRLNLCDNDWLSLLDDEDVATNLPLSVRYALTDGLVVAVKAYATR